MRKKWGVGVMPLEEKTEKIKSLSKAVKNNFLKIGKLLIEVRDKQLWNEKYKSFTQYLMSEDFDFHRVTAYRMMDVYTEYGNDQELVDKLGVGKLIELTYVADKEQREEITRKAIEEDLSQQEIREEIRKVKEEDLYKQIKRKAQREDENLYIENDDPIAKCKRQAQSILQDIHRLSYPINDMEERLKKWIKFSSKFNEDKEIDKLKAAIFLGWKKIRNVPKKNSDWFD